MHKLFNKLNGILLGIVTFAGIMLLGVLTYTLLPRFEGELIIVLLLFIALWASIKVYHLVARRGVSDFFTSLNPNATSAINADSEENISHSIEPDELVKQFTDKNNYLKSGVFELFGDRYGKTAKQFYCIRALQYNPKTGILHFELKDHYVMEVYHPGLMVDTPTFLKINEASRIVLSWKVFSEESKIMETAFIDYRKTTDKVYVDTNTERQNFNCSPNEPALIIYK